MKNTKIIKEKCNSSWKKIAPSWPLKNIIAANPISGFEDLPFDQGLKQAKAYFQQSDLPKPMHQVNIQSIKWLQSFFDQGITALKMPLKSKGFLYATRNLFIYDNQLNINNKINKDLLKSLPDDPFEIIAKCLDFLDVNTKDQEPLLTLMLTTLSGWASYVKYLADWPDCNDKNQHSVTKEEFLAFRLILTCLLWPEAKLLIDWHKQALEKNSDVSDCLLQMNKAEDSHRTDILELITKTPPIEKHVEPKTQIAFCIDVRSEPFRRALENQGSYETIGCAGFFGLPIAVKNKVSGETHHSCPVLLQPQYEITEGPSNNLEKYQTTHKLFDTLKKTYLSVKDTFCSPYGLVETVGLASGLVMSVRNFFPLLAGTLSYRVNSAANPSVTTKTDTVNIPLDKQVQLAVGILKVTGFKNFAKIVVFCGHSSTTKNNAYASSLDCGACGGRSGLPNAKALVEILNNKKVRGSLQKQKIKIPEGTLFVAAEHNTTTDKVTVFTNDNISKQHQETLDDLTNDLEQARITNSLTRLKKLEVKANKKNAAKLTHKRSVDWAQIRPEWGLAKNSCFIIGPRWMTKKSNFEGRSFLHSYEWERDKNGSSLTNILTAPMVVTQWINSQYLFSTLDNVAYGGGSKITKNVVGKIGIMQGNASDLMPGLPMQSVFINDRTPYHQAIRLSVFVYAPQKLIKSIINKHRILQQLLGNEWIKMVCIDPTDSKPYSLNKNLTWKIIQ